MMPTIIPQIFSKFTDYKIPTKIFHDTPTNSFTKRYVCCNLLRNKDGFGDQKKRVILVRFNNINFNGGGHGGGKEDEGGTTRVLGNLGLAVGLTCLSLTGKLGWIIDAIVSFWILVVLVLVVSFVALIWWVSRDMVEIKCRNCRNEFEVFKSMLNDEQQLCPYCSQPFSVVGDDLVRDRTKFSKESTTFDEAFNDLVSRSKKGNTSYGTVIDVEAEVKDAE